MLNKGCFSQMALGHSFASASVHPSGIPLFREATQHTFKTLRSRWRNEKVASNWMQQSVAWSEVEIMARQVGPTRQEPVMCNGL